MSWFGSALHAVTDPGQLVSDAEHGLGTLVDDGTWLSRGVNGRNFGDVIAPASQQQQIIRAVARATGRIVTG